MSQVFHPLCYFQILSKVVMAKYLYLISPPVYDLRNICLIAISLQQCMENYILDVRTSLLNALTILN